MKETFERFENQLYKLNLELTDKKREQFSFYYDLLLEWNQVMNLTAITEFNEVTDKHFLDSLALGKYVNIKNIDTLIDLGTGAGFPGIPLKIMFPELEVLLVDSLNKRVRFLDEVIFQLKLKGIRAVHGRAEELAHQANYREQYDLCVSRAVANLSSLSEYCLPFVKSEGSFIAYKSADLKEEIDRSKKAIQVMGGKLRKVEEFQLPDTQYRRSFVFIDKVKHTPGQYPRKAGTPAKDPL